ncbi:hypothetical protein QNN88_10125 [Citrobacter sp. ANG330]|uniref:hypothetical protein n=1 Tax=Citrobacter sp. ANG330 TaxID=3048142 RepID=UPI0039C051EB
MLFQLLGIKERREQAIRNALAKNAQLMQLTQREIEAAEQKRSALWIEWYQACHEFTGTVDRRHLTEWQETLRNYQTEDNDLGLQLEKHRTHYSHLQEEEIDLRQQLRVAMISQEKLNYIIAENKMQR